MEAETHNNQGKEQENVIVTAFFPHELAEAARVAAARQGVSRSELIRQAVAYWLEQLREVEHEPA